MTEVEPLADGLDHPEAVAWDAEREVLFCGGEEGQLYAVGLDGAVEQVACTGGSLLGLALDSAGLVYACDAGVRAVVAIDPDTGRTATVSEGAPGRPLVEPNGIALDPDGVLFVTCSGTWGRDDGVVLRVAPDGRTAVWSTAASHFPNGCLVHDGTLLVVESALARIVALPLSAPQEPSVRRALEACVPDQIALDASGALLVGCYRPDLVLREADGGVRELVRDPSGMAVASPTGLAFAGRELDRLVVTSYGARQLVEVPAPVAGSAVPRPSRTRPSPL